MAEEGRPINEPPPPFDPTAELEYLLAGAKEGKVSIVTVYQAFLRAPVYAMFDRAMDPENLDPAGNALVFETSDMGKLMVLFSTPELSEKLGADLGEFVHPGQLSGEYLAGALAEDTGIVMNPGHDFGMKLSAQGLQRLKQDFGTQGSPASERAAGAVPPAAAPSGTPFPGAQ